MSSSNSMHIIIPLLSNSCNESLQENIVWTVTTSIKLLFSAAINGLTQKREERFFYWPFFLVCIPFKTKEYLTVESSVITAIHLLN